MVFKEMNGERVNVLMLVVFKRKIRESREITIRIREFL